MTAAGRSDAAPYTEPVEGAVFELEIGAVAHGGHFVAHAPDGRVVFVRHALPGERVRALITEERSGYLRADAVEVLVASPDRVDPPCPWAGPDRCGGCDFQHASLAAQRQLKADVVREQLTRLAGFSAADIDALQVVVRALPDPLDEPGLGWRTRVQYTVDATDRAGLLKHRSHEVVAVDRCRIAHPHIQSAPVLDRAWPGHDAVEAIASAGAEVTLLGVTAAQHRSERLAGPDPVRERAIGRDWTLPARAFWQVHPAAADTLADAVVRLLAPRASERAWDLYGGVGLFAAALAPHLESTGRLTVVEADPAAAAAARRCLADLTTVTVVCSDVERALAKRRVRGDDTGGPSEPRWRSVDIVVLDPPRAGAGARVVRAVTERRPRAIAYVACDPAAFARDARTFREQGYELRQLDAYDLFPMTHHVELVALLTPAVSGS